MKKVILILLLLSFKFSANAQQKFTFDDDDLRYAAVKDTDDFVNIRKAPANNAPIVGKIYKYNVFSCESNKTNWWKVLYIQQDSRSKSNANWIEGYIYKSRVSILPNFKPVTKKDSLTVVVRKALFNPKKHKLSYLKDDSNKNSEKELERIDGRIFWGTDGEIPKEVISNIKISIKGEQVTVPKNAFEDLYGPHWGKISICHGPNNTIYISMSNSDGAGAYTIIWIIKDNKYYGRYIDDSIV